MSGILSGISSGFLSDVLFDILSGTWAGILTDILSHILFCILSDYPALYLTYILYSDILFGILWGIQTDNDLTFHLAVYLTFHLACYLGFYLHLAFFPASDIPSDILSLRPSRSSLPWCFWSWIAPLEWGKEGRRSQRCTFLLKSRDPHLASGE